MRIADSLRKPTVSATSRPGMPTLLPPFLPTLGLALVAGLMSLACREPAKDSVSPPKPVSVQAVPAMATAPGIAAFNPGHALIADYEPVPASEAFARLAPLVTASEAVTPTVRPVRGAVAARAERRRPPTNRMATTQPAVPQRAAPETTGSASVASETEGSRFLPAGALPFAAVDAAWEAARNAGTGAASLGSSVVSLVSDLH